MATLFADSVQLFQGNWATTRSLILTTKFPVIPGTHLIDLERTKGWVDLQSFKNASKKL